MRHRHLGLAVILLALVALGYGAAQAVIPEVAGGQSPAKNTGGTDWSSALADPKRSGEALDAIVRGPDAASVLTPIATGSRHETTARGWAIVGLTRLGTANAVATLDGLSKDGNQPMIVRTWANAGVISNAKTLDALAQAASLRLPGHERPVSLRAESLIAGAPVADLLLASSQLGLGPAVQPLILKADPRELVQVMSTDARDPVRRQAAGFLATIGQTKKGVVEKAVLENLAFRRNQRVPWQGGALYVPGLSWSGADAKTLVHTLAQWWLFLEGRQQDEARQVWNNLYSVGLLQTAGFDRNIQPNAVSVTQALVRAEGAGTARRLLEAVGRSGEPDLAAVLK